MFSGVVLHAPEQDVKSFSVHAAPPLLSVSVSVNASHFLSHSGGLLRYCPPETQQQEAVDRHLKLGPQPLGPEMAGPIMTQLMSSR